jgi:glutamate synthase domain-containing protein 3
LRCGEVFEIASAPQSRIIRAIRQKRGKEKSNYVLNLAGSFGRKFGELKNKGSTVRTGGVLGEIGLWKK